jgi:hypothetical protein
MGKLQELFSSAVGATALAVGISSAHAAEPTTSTSVRATGANSPTVIIQNSNSPGISIVNGQVITGQPTKDQQRVIDEANRIAETAVKQARTQRDNNVGNSRLEGSLTVHTKNCDKLPLTTTTSGSGSMNIVMQGSSVTGPITSTNNYAQSSMAGNLIVAEKITLGGKDLSATLRGLDPKQVGVPVQKDGFEVSRRKDGSFDAMCLNKK